MAYGLSNDLIRDKYFNYYDLCKFENWLHRKDHIITDTVASDSDQEKIESVYINFSNDNPFLFLKKPEQQDNWVLKKKLHELSKENLYGVAYLKHNDNLLYLEFMY